MEQRYHKHQFPRFDSGFITYLLKKPACLNFLVVLVAPEKLQPCVADADNVVDQHSCSFKGRLAVDICSRGGVHIMNKPSVVTAQQHAVIARHCGIVDRNVVGLAPSYRILPEYNRGFFIGLSVDKSNKRFFGTSAAAHRGVALVNDKNRVYRHQNPERYNADVEYHAEIKHNADLLFFIYSYTY